MAAFSDDDLRKVREASDIVTVFSERVPLRQKGRDFWCCCPVHDEKSPSCKVDPATQLWHCFGCGAGGDVFSLIMSLDGLDFPDAVRKLADRARIELTQERGQRGTSTGYKQRLGQVCKEAALFYHQQLMRGKGTGPEAARSYLKGRSLGGAVPKAWQLGFAQGHASLVERLRKAGFKDRELIDANVAVPAGNSLRDRFFDRIIFPICDAQGEVIAFGGRTIGDGQPKYLNSQETPLFHKSEVLYGLHKAKASMAATGIAVVVEGYTDVISLHAAGITNVVATLGTALTNQHLRVLARHARHRIVYLFDGDEAGQRAADRALTFIDERMTPEAGRTRIDLAAVTLPGGLDPADYVAAQGAEALRQLIDEAQPLIAYGIARRLARHDLETPEGRAYALDDALKVLAPIKTSILAKDYAAQLAGQLRAREDDVLERLAHMKAPTRTYENDAAVRLPPRAEVPPPRGAAGATAAGTSAAGMFAAGSAARGLTETGEADRGAQGAQGASSAGGRVFRQATLDALAQDERNRRRFEREFLSLCACAPAIALTYADVLVQATWHDPAHRPLAEALVDALAQNPGITAAELVRKAQERIDGAGETLTSGTMTRDTEPESLAAFLAEELRIGDLEDQIASLRVQLEHPAAPLSAEDQEALFASIVALQKDVSRRRKEHKPLMP